MGDNQTANSVKNALLRYFRFQRGFPYIATECWSEDVVASDGVRLVCVEVKISWADYKREFQKAKHTNSSCPWSARWTIKKNNPNRVFFAAPRELALKIAADVETVAPWYGVIAVDGNGQSETIRKAKNIHDANVLQISLRDIVARMTSELVTMREALRK